jgi:tripartite-type tricarboxylate transporter receptor subunit TctC
MRWHSAGLAIIFLSITPVMGRDYPIKPIRLVVGFAPGGGADGVARSVAKQLNETWGRSVIVDNRAGAGGNIAAEIVASAVPDGYTLLITSPGPIVINPALYPRLPYDPQKDLAPITLVAAGPNVLVLNPGVRASNVQELIALARSKPGGLNYASSGIGSTPHLSGELFKLAAKINLVHVAYKGAGPAVIDLMGGRVELMLVSAPSVLTQIRAHRLRALAVTSLKRSPALPELPTLDESGLPGFEATAWWGLLVTAGVSRDLIAKLNAAVVKSLNSGDTKERLAAEGAEVVGNTPAEFGDFIRKETTKWANVIKLSGIKLE